ncbi:MAG: serine protease [Clostridiales bacterium]|nr:serine protease [Clostridiales bacterium]
MAKYRIIRREQGSAALCGGNHYWREIEENQAADLDMDEIRELNRLPEHPPQQMPSHASYVFSAMISLIVIVAFTGLIFWSLAPYLRMPDLSFLSRSAELAKDDAFTSLKAAVVSIKGDRSSGSGFNLRADGLIVTNYHVVEDSVENNSDVMVTFADGRLYPVRKWQKVDDYDLAVAVIRGENLPHVELAGEPPLPGDDLIFIGNPLGFDWTISEGQIMEIISQGNIILFSGPVRSGSSGSPLFNSQGQVVGVIYASLRDVPNNGLAISAQLLFTYVE